MNLATQYLQSQGETVENWDGICGELASAIATRGDDHIVYVEGDIGWRYHMVMMRDGVVHDAWCDAGALHLRDWMVEMFGEQAWVELTIDAVDVFAGHVRDFQ
jgi:hypothetical protein